MGQVLELIKNNPFRRTHQHGPNCSHTVKKSSSGHTHSSACRHASTCSHKSTPTGAAATECKAHGQCKSPHCQQPKFQSFADRQAQRAKTRRMIQWGRRGNHVSQNVWASVWAYSISESQLRIYIDENRYDMILLFHTLQIVALIFFFWASCADPGFISKKSSKESNEETVSLLDVEAGNVTKVDLRKEVPPSLCRNCEFLRPIRAKHCYQCDRCVARFDHHCPLIQTCVGAKNYRPFFALCVSYVVVSGWSLWMAKDLVFFNERSDELTKWGWMWRIGLFLWMLYQTFLGVSMSVMHSYLISTAQTTFEFLKPKKLQRHIDYERDNGRYTDNESRRKKDDCILSIFASMLVNNGGGFFTCYYPFSEGLIANWYGFLTGECLERKGYFEPGPVKFVTSPISQVSQPVAEQKVSMTNDGVSETIIQQ